MCFEIHTDRLILRQWNATDAGAFADLHGDPVVMGDLGEPIGSRDSEEKLQQYLRTWDRFGYGRWCVTDRTGKFLGYVGVNRETGDHPIGEHSEIGWRLCRSAWGRGYAVEAARAAIKDAFERTGLTEILAYTATDNLRSQAVISRLPFERNPSLDFSVPWAPLGEWRGLVWTTNRRLASDLR